MMNKKQWNILITTADKGGAAVIMGTGNFPIKITAKHLKNSHTNETQWNGEWNALQHSKMVNDTLDWFKNENLLSKKMQINPNKSKDN